MFITKAAYRGYSAKSSYLAKTNQRYTKSFNYN